MLRKVFPLSRQFLLNIALVFFAIALKVIYITAYYDKVTGLFEKGFLPGIMNFAFYLIVVLLFALNFLLTSGVVVHFKHLKHDEPVVVGYAMFFTAVMFVVEGLFGFYSHFVMLVDAKHNFLTMQLMEIITTLMPFINDLICMLCAFAFYNMAMESFCEDDEPRRSISMSAIPVIWATMSLFNVLITTNDQMFVQGDISQIMFSMFTLVFLYFIMESYIFPQNRRKQTMFTIWARFSYAGVSMVVVIPYLIVRLFGVADHVQIMPYFALLGVSVFSVVSMMNFVFTANARRHRKI